MNKTLQTHIALLQARIANPDADEYNVDVHACFQELLYIHDSLCMGFSEEYLDHHLHINSTESEHYVDIINDEYQMKMITSRLQILLDFDMLINDGRITDVTWETVITRFGFDGHEPEHSIAHQIASIPTSSWPFSNTNINFDSHGSEQRFSLDELKLIRSNGVQHYNWEINIDLFINGLRDYGDSCNIPSRVIVDLWNEYCAPPISHEQFVSAVKIVCQQNGEWKVACCPEHIDDGIKSISFDRKYILDVLQMCKVGLLGESLEKLIELQASW